jgi:uncharacterized protein
MSLQVLETLVREYLQQPAQEVVFGWQGGEPTLAGLPFFERAIELQRRWARPGQRVVNTLQTNGTLLDEAWCRFLAAHEFLVGLSVDGPGDCHDAFRVTKGGQGSLGRVLRGAELLHEHGVRFNALTCVHAANVQHPRAVYAFLRDTVRARHIQFIPIVTRDNPTRAQEGSKLIPESVDAAQYGKFLCGVFDEWLERDVGQVFVQQFDAALAAWAGEVPPVCVYRETCGDALVVEHSGAVFSCDHFVEPSGALGRIPDVPLAQLRAAPKQRNFGQAKRDTLPDRCLSCEFRFACHGGCPKDRMLPTADPKRPLNALCEGLLAFFSHVQPYMAFMAAELAEGRSPAHVMQFARRQPERRAARQHKPCPCGSGSSFTHCHGA